MFPPPLASLVELVAAVTKARWAFTSATRKIGVLSNPAFLGTAGDRTMFNIQVTHSLLHTHTHSLSHYPLFLYSQMH